ncbi:MAG: FtsX-like permease family protein [Actinomycetota bacterium]|nr:FtsX-like permease family protein [Actinomycetota bacterium]
MPRDRGAPGVVGGLALASVRAAGQSLAGGLGRLGGPAEIINYTSMGSTPAMLAGLLVLATLVSLGLALASGVGKRRRELSILKSLGFTRRQVSGTVLWQASMTIAVGLLIGAPLGIVLGRWLWTLFADQMAVLAAPAVPLLALGGVSVGLPVMGAVVSAVPAWRGGRTPAAAILRSE